LFRDIGHFKFSLLFVFLLFRQPRKLLLGALVISLALMSVTFGRTSKISAFSRRDAQRFGIEAIGKHLSLPA
jgi:hypothetical protein